MKTHYHNTGTTPVYIGGVCVPAGSAREVDARLVPAPATVPEPPPETKKPAAKAAKAPKLKA